MPITLEQTESGTSVEVRRGDEIVVRLEENPTTGFRWAVDEINEQVLELQDSSYQQQPGGGMGGGGQRRLTFRAKSSGSSPLRLKLWREWEGDATADARYSVTVTVVD